MPQDDIAMPQGRHDSVILSEAKNLSARAKRRIYRPERSEESIGPSEAKNLSAEIDEEDGDVGRGDTGDAGGLGDGARLVAIELLATFY